MKRWLVESNEGKLTAEDIERDYHKYAEGMKWQLIENKIIKEAGIEVGDQEIKDYVKDYYLQGWRTMQPVSYTHLDVYKRQRIYRSGKTRYPWSTFAQHNPYT